MILSLSKLILFLMIITQYQGDLNLNKTSEDCFFKFQHETMSCDKKEIKIWKKKNKKRKVNSDAVVYVKFFWDKTEEPIQIFYKGSFNGKSKSYHLLYLELLNSKKSDFVCSSISGYACIDLEKNEIKMSSNFELYSELQKLYDNFDEKEILLNNKKL